MENITAYILIGALAIAVILINIILRRLGVRSRADGEWEGYSDPAYYSGDRPDSPFWDR